MYYDGCLPYGTAVVYFVWGLVTCCVVLVLCFLYAVPCGGSSIELATSGSGPVGPGFAGRHIKDLQNILCFAIFLPLCKQVRKRCRLFVMLHINWLHEIGCFFF